MCHVLQEQGAEISIKHHSQSQKYFLVQFLEPMLLNRPVNEKAVARFLKGMENCLSEIENIWLDRGKKQFIAGDKISVADLLACCELEQPGKNH